MSNNLLLEKLQAHNARVSVIGLGYVGLSLAVELARVGFTVHGVDLDLERVTLLNRGESYLVDVPKEVLGPLVASGRLSASTAFDAAAGSDALIICVPTPLRKTKEPDISYILSAVESLLPHLRAGQLMVLESTTYPGTTEEVVQPRIEAKGLVIGRDFYLAFSPERVDPGNKRFTTATIPKVVGGGHRQLYPAGRHPLPPGHRDGVRGLEPAGGRDGQASGEHVPEREHRARQ